MWRSLSILPAFLHVWGDKLQRGKIHKWIQLTTSVLFISCSLWWEQSEFGSWKDSQKEPSTPGLLIQKCLSRESGNWHALRAHTTARWNAGTPTDLTCALEQPPERPFPQLSETPSNTWGPPPCLQVSLPPIKPILFLQWCGILLPWSNCVFCF